MATSDEPRDREIAALRHDLKLVTSWHDAAEKRIEELSAQFPACPGCGCRTPDDPDRTECGCDEGCNDGDQAPGVNVLMHQRDTAEQRLADVQSEYAKRDATHGRALERVTAERDQLQDACRARDCALGDLLAENDRLRADWDALAVNNTRIAEYNVRLGAEVGRLRELLNEAAIADPVPGPGPSSERIVATGIAGLTEKDGE